MFVFFLFAMYTVYYFIKNGYVKFDFDVEKIKELTHFLFPLTFYVLGLFVMGTIDKIFIANMISIEAAGVYAVAITMTIIINLVFDAIIKAWQPYMHEYLNDGALSKKIRVVQFTYLYTLFVVLFIIAYIMIIPYIFHWMIDEKFNDALLYIPILVVGYGFEGLRKPVSGFLTNLNRVKTLGTITFIAALLNIILNIIFIEQYGVYGAAYATLISFAALYALTLVFVKKHCHLPWLLRAECD